MRFLSAVKLIFYLLVGAVLPLAIFNYINEKTPDAEVVTYRINSGVQSQWMDNRSALNDSHLVDDRSTLKDNQWKETELKLEKRRNHFREQCKRLGLDVVGDDILHKPNPWEYVISKEYKLIWCNVFKAASTTWLYNFAILAGVTPEMFNSLLKSKVATGIVRDRLPRPSLDELYQAFTTDLSFLIVRHPLERLIAVYKDKILNKSYLYKETLQMIRKYRKPDDEVEPRYRGIPTFREFIRYLVDCFKTTTNLNMHWVSVAQFCTPCFFDFQIIAHTETLDEDQNYIIYKAHLEEKIKPEWKNRGRGDTRKEISSHYSQLTKNDVLELYEYYKYDFALFNYTLDNYLAVAKPDEDYDTDRR